MARRLSEECLRAKRMALELYKFIVKYDVTAVTLNAKLVAQIIEGLFVCIDEARKSEQGEPT